MFGELKGTWAQIFFAIGVGSTILALCSVLAFVGREAIKKQKLVEFMGAIIALVALFLSLYPIIFNDSDKTEEAIRNLDKRIDTIEKKYRNRPTNDYLFGDEKEKEKSSIAVQPPYKPPSPYDPFGNFEENTKKVRPNR